MVSSEPILLWIWRYLRPYRGRVTALVALSSLEVLLRILSPWPMKAVVDHVLGSTTLPTTAAAALAPFAAIASIVTGKREQLLDDPVAARRMGAAGRERAVREFSYDVLADRLGRSLGALPE